MNYINHYINKIICGNALEVLKEIPDESINCCVCSPPYWNLRDYGVEGQLGLEKTFELYIKHLCDIFDEVKRVLRKDGTCWIVISDTYGGSGNRSGHTLETSNLNRLTIGYGATGGNVKLTRGYEKCLLDIPYRFSIEMTNRGWIKRNTLIWWKLSCMPSSASDRFTVDFEYLFYFTKNNKAIFWTNEKTLGCIDKKPLGAKGIEGKDWEWGLIGENYENYNTKISREDAEKYNSLKARKYGNKGMKKVSLWRGHDYWFEQQFENWTDNRPNDIKRAIEGHKKYKGKYLDKNKKGSFAFGEAKIVGDPKQGRNKRCVWEVPTKNFKEAHFAVYPEGLIEIPIKAGCPEFICKKCGKARVKIYEIIGKQITKNMKIAGCNKEGKYSGTEQKDYKSALAQRPSETKKRILKSMGQVKKSYYTDCGCNAGFEGGIVLDPFMGAGTTALVALKQRKRFIGIEIKQEYIDMTNKRIKKVQQEFNLG
jgi:DNA modification methylase